MGSIKNVSTYIGFVKLKALKNYFKHILFMHVRKKYHWSANVFLLCISDPPDFARVDIGI